MCNITQTSCHTIIKNFFYYTEKNVRTEKKSQNTLGTQCNIFTAARTWKTHQYVIYLATIQEKAVIQKSYKASSVLVFTLLFMCHCAPRQINAVIELGCYICISILFYGNRLLYELFNAIVGIKLVHT